MVTTATITDIVRSSYLSCLMTEPFYRCKLANYPWQGRQDLNLRPSVLETDALPTELLPYAANSDIVWNFALNVTRITLFTRLEICYTITYMAKTVLTKPVLV